MSAREPESEAPAITRILQRLGRGEPGAADDLVPAVYDELREMARHRIAQLAPGQTVQATALVHEAWMRLGGREAVDWNDRAHFFGAAARAMRFILVEQARHRGRIKRGGGERPESLEDDRIAAPEESAALDLQALDRALDRMEHEHPRPAKLVMLRYFGGLGMEEIAETLAISLRTAERDWQFARSWLRRALADDAADD